MIITVKQITTDTKKISASNKYEINIILMLLASQGKKLNHLSLVFQLYLYNSADTGKVINNSSKTGVV